MPRLPTIVDGHSIISQAGYGLVAKGRVIHVSGATGFCRFSDQHYAVIRGLPEQRPLLRKNLQPSGAIKRITSLDQAVEGIAPDGPDQQNKRLMVAILLPAPRAPQADEDKRYQNGSAEQYSRSASPSWDRPNFSRTAARWQCVQASRGSSSIPLS